MSGHFVFGVCLVVTLMVGRSSSSQETSQGVFRPFLKQHCVACHGQETQEAGLRFDALSHEITDGNAGTWRRVLKVLTKGEMPPAEQPTPDQTALDAVVKQLRSELQQLELAQRATRPMRRLDRDEYRNTIRDLLELDVSLFDPTRDFPNEIGPAGKEVVSLDSLTGHYLSAAHAVIERAIPGGPRPNRSSRVSRGRFAKERSLCAELLQKTDCETLLTGPGERRSRCVPKDFEGTSDAGRYRIKVKAAAYNPAEYFEQIQGIEAGEPLRLAVEFLGREGSRPPRIVKDSETTDHFARKVFELNRDGNVHDYEWDVWLEPDMTPRLVFANGPSERPSEVWVLNNFPKQWKYPNPSIEDQKPWQDSMLKILLDQYRGPMIHIHELSIDGPIIARWPPASEQILMSVDGSAADTQDNEERLRQFAQRAFRRPVEPDEIAPFAKLLTEQMANGSSEMDALKAGFKAILCSPSFLFLAEPPGEFDDYSIAARLSYSLWSTLPDEKLLQLAATGKLTDPAVRRQQARRMLEDPKSAAFIRRFSDRWLLLDRPDIAPPDRYTFPLYYELDLGHWSRMETQAFFRHILRNDLSVAKFIDADFAFINYELAKLYGLPGVSGRSLRKVELTDKRRGGLLGQSSVMMATATGPDTSPILRGVWVRNCILGDPPPPPPPGVEPIEPDVRGSATLRERLEKHRSAEACNSCHRQIDPLGFPLEAFDRIGKWRATHSDNRQIDTNGNLPNGDSFSDVAGLKRTLLNRKDELVRCLTRNLIEYACGQPPGVADEPEIEAIVDKLKDRGHGLQELVYLVVESTMFLGK